MAKPRSRKRRAKSSLARLDKQQEQLRRAAIALERGELSTPVEVIDFIRPDATSPAGLKAVVELPEIGMEGQLGINGNRPYIDLSRDLNGPPSRLEQLSATGSYRIRTCGHLNAIRRLTAV